MAVFAVTPHEAQALGEEERIFLVEAVGAHGRACVGRVRGLRLPARLRRVRRVAVRVAVPAWKGTAERSSGRMRIRATHERSI